MTRSSDRKGGELRGWETCVEVAGLRIFHHGRFERVDVDGRSRGFGSTLADKVLDSP